MAATLNLTILRQFYNITIYLKFDNITIYQHIIDNIFYIFYYTIYSYFISIVIFHKTKQILAFAYIQFKQNQPTVINYRERSFLMSFIEAIIMGLIQGIAEFLPISSSGHLVITEKLFNWGEAQSADLFFDMILHLGTLIAVFIVFRKTIGELIICLFKTIGQIFTGKFRPKDATPTQRMIGFLILSLLPLLLIVPFKDFIEDFFYNSLTAVGIALIINSVLLFACDRFKEGKKTSCSMRKRDALAIGAVQAIAVIPGISRSGSTITAGVGMGIERSEAAKYSFILSIPTILAAVLLDVVDTVQAGEINTDLFPQYAVGFIVSAVVGFLAIKLLQYILKSKKFIIFSAYCLIVGITVTALGFLI